MTDQRSFPQSLPPTLGWAAKSQKRNTNLGKAQAALLLVAGLVAVSCGPVGSEAAENTDTVSQATHALLAPWKETDIGAVGVAGDSSNDGSTIAVYGSGADIWGTADAFHYVYQRLNGNTQVVVKVTSVLNTNAWAKAGVMIRENLDAGSRHASVFLTPSNGVAFQSRDTTNGTSISTNVTGVATPYWVKLARSGDQLTAFSSPDGASWTQVGTTRIIGMQPSIYVGVAATSHDNTRLGSATFTNFQLQAPPALFVVGNTTLNSGDAAALKRLQTLGYSVTVKAATAATSADANGKDLVVISSTVTSSDVNTKFTNVAVPVVTWENALLPSLGMTLGTSGTDFGTTSSQTSATIFTSACSRSTMYTSAVGYGDGCHDMSAGLSDTVPILTQAGTVSWGKPGANAVQIAYQPGSTNHAIVFGYDKGVAMPGLASAPSRRVFVYLSDSTASSWTGRGQSLFDNAIYWATRTHYSITKKVLHLNYNPTLTSQGNMLLSTYGSIHFAFTDPIQLMRDYLADITEASGGYVRWQLAVYPGIPATINQWIPITGPVQFNSPSFTEQNYIDAYNYAWTTGDYIGAGQRMPNGGNYAADYNAILDNFSVDAKLNAGEVDEVIVSGYAYAGIAESTTGGRTMYPLNGPYVYRNTPNFVLMGQSYERRLSEALENFGHRAEWTMAFHVYRSSSNETLPYNPCYWPTPNANCSTRVPTPQRDLWDRFTVVDGNLPGSAGIGAAHWAPNAENFDTDQYHWELTNFAYSMGDDWYYNYPNLVGSASRRLVNVEEWRPMAQDGEPGRAFKKWWYHHMPRVPGSYVDTNAANNGKLNNWWEYIVDFNRQPETQN
jgi:hypothetical protein